MVTDAGPFKHGEIGEKKKTKIDKMTPRSFSFELRVPHFELLFP
jgi:hypothetical protein